MNGGQFFATFGVALLVLGTIVALAVLVAVIYLSIVRYREHRSNKRSFPAAMNSNPNRFSRYDEDETENEEHR